MIHTSPESMAPPSEVHKLTPEHEYGQLVSRGLERASESGFDLYTAMRAGYGEQISDSMIADRVMHVEALSYQMAEDLQLKPEFFDRPVNSILLTAIAESWLSNEERSKTVLVNKQNVIAERESLVDIASMLAGKYSGTVQDVAQVDGHTHDRYIESANDAEVEALSAFLNDHVNKELSSAVQEILDVDGEGSFLQKQREALAVTKETQTPFKVKVLDMAESSDMFVAHIQPKPEFPEWGDYSALTTEEREALAEKSNIATKQVEANNEQTKALTSALDAYIAQFGERFGAPAGAFVDRNDAGEMELYLRAPQAMALLRYFGDNTTLIDPSIQHDIEHVFAIVRHEFGHTQKDMIIGPHAQLGLILEERKAEFVSGDKLGYQDIKYMLADLSMATNTELIGGLLDKALKQEDPISAFTAQAANTIGLRNTMLLMALKPLAYEKRYEHASKFADLSSSRKETDKSSLTLSRTIISLMAKV